MVRDVHLNTRGCRSLTDQTAGALGRLFQAAYDHHARKTMTTNPEINQDRVEDTIDTFRKHGYVLFPQQRRIYELLASRLAGRNVLEAGCGNGCGTAMLERSAGHVIGTDKLPGNVAFARELYPWIRFEEWDLNRPGTLRAPVVVAVECFEHVADPAAAMKHLLAAATEELWLSTPNGKGKPRPPENPFHVAEYTVEEMMDFFKPHLPRFGHVELCHWETLGPLRPDNDVSPLVYHVTLHPERAA